MAEINMPQKGGKKRTHTSLRVELTPMVDLGFLLISFFMYTTTMAKPRTMEIRMPSPAPADTSQTKYPEESTITIIPVSGHKVFYYNGALKDETVLKITSVSNCRDILLKMKSDLARLPNTLSPEAHKLHVLIKPGDDSKYSDLVQLLDEMNISDVPYYALVDITPADKEWLVKK